MPQLNLYVDDQLAERIRRAADASGLSVSRYLAELVRREVARDWPDGFFDQVIGGWRGEPMARAAQGEVETRELLTAE